MGETLIARARRASAGWSWPDPSDRANHDLCGFSHGAAGIGHALLELSAATRDARFREAGERAFAYERWWFERRGGTWPDLRGVARRAGWDPPAPCAASWCQARPASCSRGFAPSGSGSRATRTRASGSPATSRRGSSDDFSLCHGAAGVGDVLLYAAAARREPELAELAAGVGRVGIERHHANGTGFPCGLPDGCSPALFLGLAGIGLLYLRLADPGIATPLILHPRMAG